MLDHPLEPGETSAIEKGPWHYGADYISVYFRGEPDRLQALVPSPFKVDTGHCMAYVCEIISVSESGAAMVATEPDRTSYREAAVGIACNYNGRPGVYFPVMWVTSEWSLLRGLVNGYQKRLADSIALTKLHPLNPGLKPIAPGSALTGFCVKGGVRTLSVRVDVETEGKPSDLPSFGATYGNRHYPRTDGSQAALTEPVEVSKSNTRLADVWLGGGSMQTALNVGTPRDLRGAVYRAGFTISGAKTLT